jgi:hypothetical protein
VEDDAAKDDDADLTNLNVLEPLCWLALIIAPKVLHSK